MNQKSKKHQTNNDQLNLHFNPSVSNNIIKFDSNLKAKISKTDCQERERIINKILCDAKELGW